MYSRASPDVPTSKTTVTPEIWPPLPQQGPPMLKPGTVNSIQAVREATVGMWPVSATVTPSVGSVFIAA